MKEEKTREIKEEEESKERTQSTVHKANRLSTIKDEDKLRQ